VDTVVPLPRFDRKPFLPPGIIKAALGFLVRLGGLIAVLPTIVSIAAEPTRAEASLNEADSHHSVADA
jgi:hypothetical protein